MIDPDETFVHREQGKKWTLPRIISAEGGLAYFCKKFTYDILGYRKPRKGEHYLSGAVIQAWRAPNDLSQEFLVVKIKNQVKPKQVWVEV